MPNVLKYASGKEVCVGDQILVPVKVKSLVPFRITCMTKHGIEFVMSHEDVPGLRLVEETALAVGNVVVALYPNNLMYGSRRYDVAVITSMEPFILVSDCGDMLWYDITPDMIRSIGQASPATMERVTRRLMRQTEDIR